MFLDRVKIAIRVQQFDTMQQAEARDNNVDGLPYGPPSGPQKALVVRRGKRDLPAAQPA